MHTLTKQEQIIETELSKIEGTTNVEKGNNGNILTYKMITKRGILLSVSKTFYINGEAKQYQVAYAMRNNDIVLISGTIDIRELVRKCNDVINEDCFSK